MRDGRALAYAEGFTHGAAGEPFAHHVHPYLEAYRFGFEDGRRCYRPPPRALSWRAALIGALKFCAALVFVVALLVAVASHLPA